MSFSAADTQPSCSSTSSAPIHRPSSLAFQTNNTHRGPEETATADRLSSLWRHRALLMPDCRWTWSSVVARGFLGSGPCPSSRSDCECPSVPIPPPSPIIATSPILSPLPIPPSAANSNTPWG
ncbi:hypothetical protein PGT21_017535 [Puccinia graminis f. sp. tritici]|uniref:Uncharacterized protein n=1 Tax=Puccinia graminis f. sp. tritici TaxID=56615 RepID=A0A5B0QIQ5_PUCGR|nr:hypothetical protein PGT21_017535 [Puccinia graminis f. sp. tritici]